MDRVSVNEKTAFNCTEDDLPFYIDCLHRKIQKSSPQPIYHYHEKIELLYCIKGELEVTLFSHPVILKKGDCLYLAPNTPHATSAASNSNEHICVKFLSSVIHVPSSRRIPPENYYISLTPDHKLFKADEDNSELFRKLFFSCIENFSHDDYFKRLILRADIMQIMGYVFENTIIDEVVKPADNISTVFLNVLDYIDKNTSTITLEEASDYCLLSYSYFSRTFKSIFGVSFSKYVIKKRIKNSLKLMQEASMSLNDIALECGFSNLSHFIKCFNNEMGMTPKQFRTTIAAKK